MSSIESCREQNWQNQVHRASDSEIPDPSRAENVSEQIFTVSALLNHISAGRCLANGCTYTHNRTHAHQQACTPVLIQCNIPAQHHTHIEEELTPLHGNFLLCAKSISPHCFVLIWPPIFFFFFLIHLPACISFAFPCFPKRNECYAKAVLVQCLPSKVRKMANAIWHTKMGEKCKQEQSCQTLSEA